MLKRPIPLRKKCLQEAKSATKKEKVTEKLRLFGNKVVILQPCCKKRARTLDQKEINNKTT
jgi:hypothetical protein